MRASEILGLLGGVALAPFMGLGSALRRARLFHPEGVIYRAEVSPLPSGRGEHLARRLSGPAMVRFSSALWRGGREWIDALGCAVRFRSEEVPSVVPTPGDQDLLFATIRTPWTTPVAPLSTHWHDYLRNDFYAVSPFSVEDLGAVKFRVCSPRVALRGPNRAARLDRAVREGLGALRLEFKVQGERRWVPFAVVRLLEQLDLDQETLRFDPFRSGRGIHPRGFVHHLRPAVYRLSQLARPRSVSEQTKGAEHKARWAPTPVRMQATATARPWEKAPPHLRHRQQAGMDSPFRPPPIDR